MRPLVVLAAVLLLTAGCGATRHDAAPGSVRTTAATTPTTIPTSSTTAVPTPTAAPRKNLPPSYPRDEVPLIDGALTSRTQGSSAQGWIAHLEGTGTQRSCFDAAAAKLVARGFTKQAEVLHAHLLQAQFTSSTYAVLLVSGASPEKNRCALTYTVGALGG